MEVVSPAIRHEKLVHMVLNRYFRKNFAILFRHGYRYEDLVQEGLYAILRAEPHFDPSACAESTYYARAVYNWIASRLCTKYIHNKKYRINATAVSLDANIAWNNFNRHYDDSDGLPLLGAISCPRAMTEDQMLDKIMMDAAMEQLRAAFPKQHKVICMRYYGGMQSQEVAPVLGCSTSNVGYLTQRGLENLRTFYAKKQGGTPA